MASLHVGHGRQRDRLQYRVDLRHLSVPTSAAGASDATICGWGGSPPLAASALGGRGVRGDGVQQHHGPAAAGVRLRERAAVRHLPLGMFWRRATGHGAFAGLLAGTLAAAVHHGLTLPAGAHAGVKGGWFGVVHSYPSELAQTFWTAIFAWVTCFLVTIVVSLADPAPAGRGAARPGILTDSPAERLGSLVPRARESWPYWSRSHGGAQPGVLLGDRG